MWVNSQDLRSEPGTKCIQRAAPYVSICIHVHTPHGFGKAGPFAQRRIADGGYRAQLVEGPCLRRACTMPDKVRGAQNPFLYTVSTRKTDALQNLADLLSGGGYLQHWPNFLGQAATLYSSSCSPLVHTTKVATTSNVSCQLHRLHRPSPRISPMHSSPIHEPVVPCSA